MIRRAFSCSVTARTLHRMPHNARHSAAAATPPTHTGPLSTLPEWYHLGSPSWQANAGELLDSVSSWTEIAVAQHRNAARIDGAT